MQKPSVGRIVHYVSYGTPIREDGSQAFTQECRAAIVTEVNDVPTGPNGEYLVGLCVLNPTGQFFNRNVEQDEGPIDSDGELTELPRPKQGGTWHWPERI